MKLKFRLIFGGFIALHIFLGCQENSNNDSRKLSELFSYCNQNQMYNGVVFVKKGQEVLYHEGFGMADFENNIKNNKNSKFRIGSLTKPITSMAIFELIKEGKVSMKSRVSECLPQLDNSPIGNISIYQLLTHTSGIKDYVSIGNRDELENRKNSPREIIGLIKDLPLLFEPGSRYKYSSSNSFLLGVIIESASQKEYIEVLQEKVLSKANMSNTGIGDKYFDTLLSKGYYKKLAGFELADTVGLSYPFSAGFLYSTANDLSSFIDLINLESKSSDIGKQWMADTIRPFGLGVTRIDTLGENRKTMLVHNGGIYGYSSKMVWVKEDDIKIILLTNDYNKYLNVLAETILAILYQKNFAMPKKHLSDYLLDKYRGNGSFTTIKLTGNELKKCQVSEKELTMFGYSFVKTKDYANAEALFRFAIELFPESDNATLCLGNIYDRQNELDSAKYYYNTTLKLNPENKEAKLLLERLE